MKNVFKIAFFLAAMTALEATHLDDTNEVSESPPAALGWLLMPLL
jgi:hypothetical protein